jgi:RNA polymerase sigma-70 factor (ECF subfamily)
LSEDGKLVLLSAQDRSLWNEEQIREADELLRATDRRSVAGPYQLQAWIARIHAHALTADDVNWREVVRLYDELQLLYPSPVIALNRAVAIGFAYGPAAALTILDTLLHSDLSEYYLLHLARADALKRLGRINEAVTAYETALQLTRNTAEQQHLRDLIGSLYQR